MSVTRSAHLGGYRIAASNTTAPDLRVSTMVALQADPAGEFRRQRESMVADQIAHPLDGRPAVQDPRVLAAMRSVPRHRFVDEQTEHLAYIDRPLPIGHRQTISQPYIVAFMTELLEVQPDHDVLEIGTGCGYQAAVLSELVRHVYTIEIVEALAQQAKVTLDELGYKNISVRADDGYLGWPDAAPFDRVILTAAPDHIPQPLIDQLKPGGRMVLPVGNVWSTQQLMLVTRDAAGKIHEQAVMAVGFVPLTRQ